MERLRQAQMVDDDARVRMPRRQFAEQLELVPTQHVHRQPVFGGAGENPMQAGMARAHGALPKAVRKHQPNADHARPACPSLDLRLDVRRARIERLDQPEPRRMLGVHLQRVAAVVAVHPKRRNEQRPVHAHRVHRRNHLLARRLRRPDQRPRPRPLGAIPLVGVNLTVDHGRLAHGRQSRSTNAAGATAATE